MKNEIPLIRELDGLFRQDPDINELGIIFIPPPNSSTERRKSESGQAQEALLSQPKFILREHKLGVSVHSVHPLINEARAAFPVARREYQREWEKKGKGIDWSAGAVAAADRLLSVTRALLLVNADHGSAWNARKELAQGGVFTNIRQEIKLLNLIFTKHAKSPNAWAHRRWCWRNDEPFGRRQQREGTWRPLAVEEELRVCQRVADLYPKNYYAWTQRSWVVLRAVGEATSTPEGSEDREEKISMVKDLLQREVDFVDGWLTSHVSDHSALNHRKNIVSALSAVSPALDFVKMECASNSTLICDYPGHESLWCYRRFLCQVFLVATPTQNLHKPQRLRTEQPGAHPQQETEDCVREVVIDSEGISPETGQLEDGYDWSGWRCAAVEWYEDCSRAEAMSQEDSCSDGVGDTDRSDEPDSGSDHGPDYESVEGELPGAPANGSVLAEFLGREVRFAFKCATDKGAWQFRHQRRHALVYLAFVTYAANRVLNRGEKTTQVEKVSSDRAGPRCHDTGAIAIAYCEVTGAPKLAFPLFSTSENNMVEDRSDFDGRRDRGGCLRALEELNEFVRDLPRVKDFEDAEKDCGRGVAVLYGL